MTTTKQRDRVKQYQKLEAEHQKAEVAKNMAAMQTAAYRLDKANDCDELNVRICAAVEHLGHVVGESCGTANLSDVLFAVAEYHPSYTRAEIMESLVYVLSVLMKPRDDQKRLAWKARQVSDTKAVTHE